jgi:hypothetical protein
MTDLLTVKVIDHSNEKANTRIHVPDRTAANFDTQQALYSDLVAAIEGVILGNVYEYVSLITTGRTAGLPASGAAQRELKWVVTYADNVTGDLYRAEIPTADVVDISLRAGNSDLWDPTATPWITFINAFEAVVQSKVGNPVTIQQVYLAGRNL